jgi:hypothetical protein
MSPDSPASSGPRAGGRTFFRIHLLGLAAAFLLLAGALTGQASAAKGGLELGIGDATFHSRTAAQRDMSLDRAVQAGADIVAFETEWRGIASSQPGNPTDPADPAYDWSVLDSAVRGATARGLQVMLVVHRAPDWAEGANPPQGVREGTWRPSPAKLREFATALATRYSGSFPDPVGGAPLPSVHLWQVWAEPNLAQGLWPQSKRRKGKLQPESPDRYRKLLDAGYDAIKGVSSTNTVIAAGTGPFGDYAAEQVSRIPPLRFWRKVFCLRGKKLRKGSCSGPKARFDVLAHNPLSGIAQLAGLPTTGSPWTSARKMGGGPDDVVVPDMKKLKRLLRKARARGTIRTPRNAPLWATELLWVTDPPDSRGLAPGVQANYLADALYLLWKQGVSAVNWAGLVDPSGGSTDLASGLYFSDWAAKPALNAFRFPFVALSKRGKVKVWGKAPSGGAVEIQRQEGGGWTAVKSLSTGASDIFTGNVPGAGGALRAVSGAETSLSRQPR